MTPGNRDLERLTNVPKVTQLVSGKLRSASFQSHFPTEYHREYYKHPQEKIDFITQGFLPLDYCPLEPDNPLA